MGWNTVDKSKSHEARANGDAPPYGDDGVAASAMLT